MIGIYPYIFAPDGGNLSYFKLHIRSNIIQYLRFTTLGCKNIEIGKPEFAAKTQFLC